MHAVVRWSALALGLALASPSHGTGPAECAHPAPWRLPKWFQAARVLDPALEISCHLNPFYLRGDFDGDGRPDLAVLVAQRVSRKLGIAVVHRRDLSVALLGAGKPFGNGGDHFDWLDVWRVEERTTAAEASDPSTPRFEGELLFLEKAESASARVGRVEGRYVWRQAGD